MADPTGFLTRCARDHGDLVPLRLGPKRALLINHPALVEEVLVHSRTAFAKPFSIRTDKLEAAEDNAGDGDVWSRARLAQGAFHRTRVEGYGRIMTEVVGRELDSWRPGDMRDLGADMDRLAFAIVTRTLFGAEADDQAGIVASALPPAMTGFLDRARTLFLIPQRWPTPGNRRLNRALRELEGAMDRVLAQGAARDDGTGGMLAALAAGTYDPVRVRDEALTFLIAGYETVAATLAWTWCLLSQHPAVDAALAGQVRAAVGDRPPAVADLASMPLVRHVVQEALRLYPPLWLVVRTATCSATVGGQRVAKGDLVLMSPWALQRDPRFFAEPDRFRPERWEGGFEKRLPRYAYFPFGGGTRGCIGSGFAMLEAQLVVAAVAHRFRPVLAPGDAVRPLASVTLRPRGGVNVVLHARRPLADRREGAAR